MKPKTPAQIAAALSRTKDPNKAHTLYWALLTSLPSGSNVGPFIASKPARQALNLTR